MDNFELIDDYLTNRLQEADRKAFEQQLAGDPALKEEVALQRQIVEGVQHARVTELKSMLNNVPVSGGFWSGGKIAAAVVSTGILITAVYFYMSEDNQIATTDQVEQVELKTPASTSDVPILTPSSSEVNQGDSANIQVPAEDKSTVSKEKKVTPVHKPDIQVVDPSAEFTESEKVTTSVTPQRTEISASKMEVITGMVDKKHNFHYQFVQGKLMLYGPFDKSLYEILEIHGEGHAVFLFYKENYYLLDETQSNITQLQAIRDAQLLKKLKEYRGQ